MSDILFGEAIILWLGPELLSLAKHTDTRRMQRQRGKSYSPVCCSNTIIRDVLLLHIKEHGQRLHTCRSVAMNAEMSQHEFVVAVFPR